MTQSPYRASPVDRLVAGDSRPKSYEELTDSALSALMDLIRDGRTRFSPDELKPFWDFVRAVAVERVLGSDRRHYDLVDELISRMGRMWLIKLAIQGYAPNLLEAFSSYSGWLVNSEHISAAVCLFFSVVVTADWVEDSMMLCDARVPGLEMWLEILRSAVADGRSIMAESIRARPAIGKRWGECVSLMNGAFAEGFDLVPESV